ncbi:MAG: hypothetical protein Q7S58_17750 [Candidatus Binatus sp.]|nr:hypothetical protein [Candidatus Binatus sp.]
MNRWVDDHRLNEANGLVKREGWPSPRIDAIVFAEKFQARRL